MKKTLTIFLSLVGITMAEASIVQELFTLTEAAETKSLYIPGEDSDVVDNSWTFVLALDPTALAQLSGGNLREIFDLSFEEGKSTGVGYYPTGPAQFVVTKGTGNVSGLTSGLDFSWDNVSGAGLTFVTSQGAKNVAVSIYQYIALNDGSVIENWYTGKNLGTTYPATLGSVTITSEAVQSATCYYGSATEAEAGDLAKKAATNAVPEPTTATLSLLALAGLAARRRRK